MTTTEITERLFESINTRELDDVAALLTDDTVFYFPKTAPLEGKRRIITFFKVLFRKFPSLSFSIGRVIANESMAAVEWTNHGTLKDNTPYANAGVTVIEVNEGVITYMSDTFKDTGLF
ncbi:MAG: nuclear transport factor 2 family protein [Deltaproteobacteria bacterium]|nr:nuclear transport factor 2 family protein [Deltaproteobacteria bacterium]MBN2673722.1 nuclear transport factor 2 family protein [Deltaproteobacteria bacterium]